LQAVAKKAAAKAVRVAPVTKRSLAAFEALFSSRGAPHYCWCAVYRAKGNHELSNDARHALMRGLVTKSTPIGVLAYAGKVPIGWCSVAPRESYVKLERSRTMPRVSDAPTWVVLCFFVVRSARGSGVTRALLDGAIRYARAKGAKLLEAYPYDSANVTATHRGHSRLFRSAGFEQDGRRWFKALRP
jgi:GNAT superfamily N-acetyltransferase